MTQAAQANVFVGDSLDGVPVCQQPSVGAAAPAQPEIEQLLGNDGAAHMRGTESSSALQQQGQPQGQLADQNCVTATDGAAAGQLLAAAPALELASDGYNVPTGAANVLPAAVNS